MTQLFLVRVLVLAAFSGAWLCSTGVWAIASERNLRLGPHDLNGFPGSIADLADVCSFCHTPSGRVNHEPQWTRSGEAASRFATFDARNGTGAVQVVNNVSVACLSCHDGTQAPDVYARAEIAESGLPPRITRSAQTNDHPVGIEFTGGTLSESDLSQRLRSAMIDGRRQWWLDLETVPNGVRDKSDAIFYARDGRPRIECATCHDPHANARNRFLRISNDGSRLCMACHAI